MKTKNHICPYLQNHRRCTHKGTDPKKTNKKRYCGYDNCFNCELFQEWLELVSASHNTPYNVDMDSLGEYMNLKEKTIPTPTNPPLNNKGKLTNGLYNNT